MLQTKLYVANVFMICNTSIAMHSAISLAEDDRLAVRTWSLRPSVGIFATSMA